MRYIVANVYTDFGVLLLKYKNYMCRYDLAVYFEDIDKYKIKRK